MGGAIFLKNLKVRRVTCQAGAVAAFNAATALLSKTPLRPMFCPVKEFLMLMHEEQRGEQGV